MASACNQIQRVTELTAFPAHLFRMVTNPKWMGGFVVGYMRWTTRLSWCAMFLRINIRLLSTRWTKYLLQQADLQPHQFFVSIKEQCQIVIVFSSWLACTNDSFLFVLFKFAHYLLKKRITR